MHAPSRQGCRGIAALAAANACGGCATWSNRRAATKCAPKLAPAQDRTGFPCLGLARDQTLRRLRTIETRSQARNFSTSAATAAGAVATPSMMLLASRVSGMVAGSMTSRCCCHSVASISANRRCRRRKRMTSGRSHRSAIYDHVKLAVSLFDPNLLVEPLAPLRAHGAARRLGGFERLIDENVLEQIAHAITLLAAPPHPSGRGLPRACRSVAFPDDEEAGPFQRGTAGDK